MVRATMRTRRDRDITFSQALDRLEEHAGEDKALAAHAGEGLAPEPTHGIRIRRHRLAAIPLPAVTAGEDSAGKKKGPPAGGQMAQFKGPATWAGGRPGKASVGG